MLAVLMRDIATDDVEVDTKDDRGHSPLSYAAEEGHEPVVKILVMWDDIEVNTKDDHGCLPLSYAAEHVNQAVVKILVTWDDVEVDTKDHHGRSSLSYAAEHGIRQWWRSLLRGTTSRWTPSTTRTTGMVICHCPMLPNMGVRCW